MVREVFFERDGLPVCLDSTISLLWDVRNSLSSVGERRLEQHRRLSAGSPLLLVSLLFSLASNSVFGVARLLSDKIVAHCARLMCV